MDIATTTTTAEAEIRALIERWLAAARASDVDGIVATYAPDLVAFDAIAQLRFKGAEAYRRHWQACLEMCPGPMSFEIAELAITAGADVAFSHALCRCGGTGPDGQEHASWMRVSAGYRKVDGRWLIAHEHFSAPFDPMSHKALFDLTP